MADARADRGLRSHLSGEAAEAAVTGTYLDRGAKLLDTRWRGQGGEIDLIFADQGVIVFCEVKKAGSFEEAAARLRPAQMRRIHAAASEYLARLPNGQLTELRFDLAMVDGRGEVRIAENAFGHF
ncbi:MAG: YraN family protein [Rhodobacteraceae bacterium]|nr:YraN family protein [Paracoccaceae bacterium]